MDNAELNDLFENATEFVRSNTNLFDSKSLLFLYARYKQAKEGRCTTTKPGFFDFQGKHKWDVWHNLKDMSRATAMADYITEVGNRVPDWQHQAGRSERSQRLPGQTGLGVAVSTMANSDSEIDDELKTVFDWCKEGDVKRVTRLIHENPISVNTKDSEGMVLLHWACDRGLQDMVQVLLGNKADINTQDNDHQTALHYAVSCGHPEIVRLLLERGIDTSLHDIDGSSACDLDTTPEVTAVLNRLRCTDR